MICLVITSISCDASSYDVVKLKKEVSYKVSDVDVLVISGTVYVPAMDACVYSDHYNLVSLAKCKTLYVSEIKLNSKPLGKFDKGFIRCRNNC
jgi:hypothetical protein